MCPKTPEEETRVDATSLSSMALTTLPVAHVFGVFFGGRVQRGGLVCETLKVSDLTPAIR